MFARLGIAGNDVVMFEEIIVGSLRCIGIEPVLMVEVGQLKIDLIV